MPDIVSPIDDQVAYTYSELGEAEALAKLDRADEVQRQWQEVPLSRRLEVCRAMLQRYGELEEHYAEQITRMMGKPLAHARGEYRGPMRERTLALCDMAEAALADHVLPQKLGFDRFIRREPVGTVLDIAAWNYPLIIPINVVVPAVLAGNAVVVKHAHQTALVADQLEQAFTAAGAPEGLVQALPVDHVTVAELIAKRRFGFVAFTGSVRGGHEVYRTVAHECFVGVGLELGGKDPALVLPDCDFDFTVDNLVDGAFFNAGQSCCGIERIYVHEQLYDRFVDAYVAKTRQYVVGSPLEATTTLGPVVSATAAEGIRAHIEQALAMGARALCGTADFAMGDLGPCYVAPHVLVDVDHRMEVMSEETFGPVVGIMKVADEDEAVALANDSRYGLTASVWTQDADRGLRLMRRLQAGTVYMNRCDYLDPGLAWTGVKDSGHGASLSPLGFLSVTRPKSYHLRTQT
ncbi:aldehyde dehydrogenase family protein [Paraliomyxa miuraensis]|uniref:aldehyde dehydrogenase family protein n=1 Tax=Paraliomyxa miuraensis TaxID=376150 RepID=UPI00225A19ED|nr:aldehyde dehydrogenase family protein [Paraliomyxa miuraensis]MCX4247061.1 aldehyde dehydrogenase family protein [Paraliomyxa miuraensis]